MKTKLLSFILLFSFHILQAQTTYTIGPAGNIVESISAGASVSYIFNIDVAFANKKFDIYTDDGTHQNTTFNLLGSQIPKNSKGGYTVTIDAMHKLKECSDDCLFTVTDKFSVKLDGTKLGDFLLKSLGEVGQDGGDPPGAPTDSYNGGSIINDALFIASGLNSPAAKGKIIELLAKQYKITDDSEKKANKFLAGEIPDGFFNSVHGGTVIDNIANSVGGLDVTNIADGFAKFIVKRTKQELSIAFFKRFKEDIASNPDLKTVFPATSNLLNAIDEQIYNYSNYINNLREAFRSDLLVIDENLPGIIENHKAFFAKTGNEVLAPMLRSGSYIASSLKHKMHPGDILDGYPVECFNAADGKTIKEFDHLKGAVQSLQLFSESLKESDTVKHRYWVGVDKLRKLVNDQKALKIYLGLVLQVAKEKYSKVPFSENTNDDLYTHLNNGAANFSSDYGNYKQYLLTLGNKVDELENMLREYDKTASDSVKVEHYAKFFRITVQLIQSSTKVADLKFLSGISKLKELPEKSKKYFDVAFEISDLVTAINRKRYPEVVNHVIVLYNSIYASPVLAQVDANTVKLTTKQKKDIADLIVKEHTSDRSQSIETLIAKDPAVQGLIKDKDTEAGKAMQVLAKMTKYGAFMSNMMYAKSSNEVADAIESVALPVGSSSVKRESSFNVSLNAYCGLFVGNEIIKGLDTHKPFSKFNSFGLSAPIGISISKGNSLLPWPLCFLEKGNSGFSSSLFISLVDLGAIAAFRFQDSTTEQVPSIKLKDIFSPGIFWSLGIPKTPISLNFGTQIGPNLRKVIGTENDYSGNIYTRYSMSVCVDIPLLNLYTKSKN